MSDLAKTFMVEGAQLIFRNFEGKEGPFNRKGDRSVSIVLSPEIAEQLLADGWNVKQLKSREEEEDGTFYITAAINYENRPPKIVMITSRARTTLDANTVETLDYAEFTNVDVLCRAHDWNVGDKSGTKAYVKSMYVTVLEDELEKKYADLEKGK